jgi:hypothetical protein
MWYVHENPGRTPFAISLGIQRAVTTVVFHLDILKERELMEESDGRYALTERGQIEFLAEDNWLHPKEKKPMPHITKMELLAEANELWRTVSSDPVGITPDMLLVSQPLCDLIWDIWFELRKPRTDWKKMAELTAVKSRLVCAHGTPEEIAEQCGDVAFWCDGGDGMEVYASLDHIHEEATRRIKT